jgi:hypothetical protein
MLTGLAATVGGLSLGLYARLQPSTSSTQERLNPNQSFPDQPDWNPNTLWQPWDDAPAPARSPRLRQRTRRCPQPPTLFLIFKHRLRPPPAVAQPEPTPEPLDQVDQAVDPWDFPLEPGVTSEPVPPIEPAPLPAPETAPAPEPVPPPAPLEPKPMPNPPAGAAPPPLTPPPIPNAPAPSSS